MKSSSSGSAAKMERKTVEKNRRMHMKNLCSKLSSLIPKEHMISTSKDVLTQQDHLDLATSYIKLLQNRIENLKQRRELGRSIDGINNDISSGMKIGIRLPVIEVRHQDSNLEVVLISGLNKSFMFHELIGILEEEGAEVVSASFSVVGDKIFHIIHSKAVSSRIGLEASRVSERLNELVR